MSTMSPLRRTLAVAGAAALALGLAACSSGGETRDEAGEIVSGGDTDVFTIKIGDCFNDVDSDSEEISSLPTVPCAEAHDNEVYAETSLTGDEYPGDDVVAQQADQYCYEQFSAFVGVDYESSTLEYYPITPLQGGWEQLGDRLVSCVVYDPAESTTGSLAGAAR
ncbi:putative regulator of septum formation [Salana multivorans]|uniref:Putative regulator of septum formation n=1 Tax=Salana multivorans TaxID=120377 RepID=A0A3N2D7G4_9MICO|nr:septum formation family protein [Salana multivorans]MBN8882898.1 septum formation family protein [Salana multivorans]OJX98298.1 MAG: hypothetical protein BGO96_03670 [Micrococcales bacterium 73-15]ROR95695.1 putative regulator of septum formation [Salana multivorans]